MHNSVSHLSPGDRVFLNTPDNPYTHTHQAWIKEVTEWGAYVVTDATETKRFRALWEEMSKEPPLSTPDDYPLETPCYQGPSASDTVLETQPPTPTFRAREMGYTGNVCPMCGGLRMVREGTCEKCQDCGQTTGCS